VTPAEVLRKARELIATPDTWIRGDYARDVYGESVSASSYTACRWCSSGAISKARGPDGPPVSKYLKDVIGGRNVAGWNDDEDRTHAEVLAAFDEAIRRAEAAQ
jgi:hypothetical protein